MWQAQQRKSFWGVMDVETIGANNLKGALSCTKHHRTNSKKGDAGCLLVALFGHQVTLLAIEVLRKPVDCCFDGYCFHQQPIGEEGSRGQCWCGHVTQMIGSDETEFGPLGCKILPKTGDFISFISFLKQSAGNNSGPCGDSWTYGGFEIYSGS